MTVPITIVNNFIKGHVGRGRSGFRPELIVMHIQEGMNDLHDEFAYRAPGNEADCTIWSKQDGTLVRFLNDEDTTWTNGSWDSPNLSNPVIKKWYKAGVYSGDISLTIEHQGFAIQGTGRPTFSEKQLQSSARMCAYWCDKFSIPADRDHIVGHYEVGPHKSCPGPNFPWSRFIPMVQNILKGNKPVEQKTEPKNPIEGGDGNNYWVISPMREIIDANPATGLVMSGMQGARDAGLDFDGLVQYTERDRWEAHEKPGGGYDVMRGRIGAEYLALKKYCEQLEDEIAKLKAK